MRKQARIILAACFYYSGIVRLAYWWKRQHSGQHLIILKYHRAAGGDLRRQMLYLRRHYRILPLETALQELYAPYKKQHRARERRIPLALTFDDGYYDNYTDAFAIACELQIPFTIFLPPGYVGGSARFWWLESNHLLTHAQVEEVTIDGQAYHLLQPEERKALLQVIDARLTYAASVSQREAFLAKVRSALGVHPDSASTNEDATRPVTWGEVQKMLESGRVSFGAHTMHHPVLACLADREELRWEVEECRAVLEQHLGRVIRTFAYPIGSPGNIGEEGLRAVKQAGYEWAVTTVEDVNTPQTDPHLLKRLNGNEKTHWLVMASELVGLLPIVSRLKKKMRRIPS
jgi:peptidoglycan/xylan/chitin deacetylase (PgdA/CDA1 family)